MDATITVPVTLDIAPPIRDRYYLSTTQNFDDATNETIAFNAIDFESVPGSMNLLTGIYKFPKKDKFDIHASFGILNSINIASNNRVALYYRVTRSGVVGPLQKISGLIYAGTAFETFQINGGDTIDANKDDLLEIVGYIDFSISTYPVGSVNKAVTYVCIKSAS